MKLRSLLFSIIIGISLLGMQSAHAQITEKPEYGAIAIVGATIHTVSNGIIENGTVLVKGSRIEYVGPERSTEGYTRIDGSGKHLYPGMIDSGTLLGLQEIGAVAVTNDQAELGNLNPHIRAFSAINPSSVSIPVTRVNGVTTVLAHPISGTIAGKATLIDLYGYSPDSMAIVPDAALHVSWPASSKRGWWDRRTEKEIKDQYEENLKTLQDFWDDARIWNTIQSSFEKNPKGKTKPAPHPQFEAMRPVFSGDLVVMITVDREKDILESLKWIAKEKEKGVRFVLSSVAEGWRVADTIAEADVPCLVGPTLRTPARSYENYQRPYQNAGILQKAGVMIAIRSGGTENVRNLPYEAGYAATYGLGKEEAIKAVTINPAKIFGIENHLGSIEVGKQANLVLVEGDLFEPVSTIHAVVIKGRSIPLVSRHTQLYDEYIDRGETGK